MNPKQFFIQFIELCRETSVAELKKYQSELQVSLAAAMAEHNLSIVDEIVAYIKAVTAVINAVEKIKAVDKNWERNYDVKRLDRPEDFERTIE